MPDDLFEKIALLFVGWLLGLLGPIIVESIKRKREDTLGRVAILSELKDLATTLALAAYGVHLRQGTFDRVFLEWLKADLEQHAITPEIQAFIPRLRQQLALGDLELNKLALHLSTDDGKGTILQHYPVPLLDARVSALWSFETNLQRQLLEVRQNVALLDDLVERSRKYLDMTFTKLEGENYRLVQENLEQACAIYAQRAQRTVGIIRRIEST